jgi:hypothetical protein
VDTTQASFGLRISYLGAVCFGLLFVGEGGNMKLRLGIILAIGGVALYLFHRDVALLVFGNAFSNYPDVTPQATLPDENMIAGCSYIVLGISAVLSIVHFVSKSQPKQAD